jgi:hypothetical protein
MSNSGYNVPDQRSTAIQEYGSPSEGRNASSMEYITPSGAEVHERPAKCHPAEVIEEPKDHSNILYSGANAQSFATAVLLTSLVSAML